MVMGIYEGIKTAASYADPREYGLRIGRMSEIARRANQIAGPLVLTTGLYYASGVAAGPLLYIACLSSTTTATWGTMFWAAAAWCAPLATAPGP